MNGLVWDEHQGLHHTSSLLQWGAFPRLHATRDLPCSFPVLAAFKHLAKGLKGCPLRQMLSPQQNTKPLQSISSNAFAVFLPVSRCNLVLPHSTTMLKASESICLTPAAADQQYRHLAQSHFS